MSCGMGPCLLCRPATWHYTGQDTSVGAITDHATNCSPAQPGCSVSVPLFQRAWQPSCSRMLSSRAIIAHYLMQGSAHPTRLTVLAFLCRPKACSMSSPPWLATSWTREAVGAGDCAHLHRAATTGHQLVRCLTTPAPQHLQHRNPRARLLAVSLRAPPQVAPALLSRLIPQQQFRHLRLASLVLRSNQAQQSGVKRST